MSIGPLVVGFLLRRFGVRQMLSWCVLLLAVSTIFIAVIPGFDAMKLMRFIQGGIIAAQLATTMTYIAGFADNMRQVMAYYVGALVSGGLIGRLSAGFITEYADWQFFFYFLGAVLIYNFVLTLQLPEVVVEKKKDDCLDGTFSVYKQILRDSFVRKLYLAIFCAFFVMTAVLNFVPFRLEALNPSIGEAVISLFYAGFLVSIVISSNAPAIADRLGGAFPTAKFSVGTSLLGLLIGLIPHAVAVFIAVLLVTSGFFLQHASIATMLNWHAGARSGQVNSLYISIYYLGGSIGSYLPGFLLIGSGWLTFSGLLIVVGVFSLLFMVRVRPTEMAFLKVS